MFGQYIPVNAQYNEPAYRVLFLLGGSLIKQSSSEMALFKTFTWFKYALALDTHTHADDASQRRYFHLSTSGNMNWTDLRRGASFFVTIDTLCDLVIH